MPAVFLGLLGLVLLLIWGLGASFMLLAYITASATGGASGGGWMALFFALTLLVPLGLLGGSVWCAVGKPGAMRS